MKTNVSTESNLERRMLFLLSVKRNSCSCESNTVTTSERGQASPELYSHNVLQLPILFSTNKILWMCLYCTIEFSGKTHLKNEQNFLYSGPGHQNQTDSTCLMYKWQDMGNPHTIQQYVYQSIDVLNVYKNDTSPNN